MSAQNYYPFGMMMPGRKFTAGAGYRYGFQGQEADNEVKGEGNSVNYSYRVYDPRIGKFLSIDPLTKKYPHYSPYHFSSNQPIHAPELEGLESAQDLDSKDPNVLLMYNWAQQDGEKGATLLNNKYYNAFVDARSKTTAAGLLVITDVWITKGCLTNTFLLSQGLGLTEHNRAKSPEGRANQDERIRDNATNFAITLGGGITAYRFFSTVFNIASATEKTFEMLYRVQGGGRKLRFQVTSNSVSINGDDMLFVNIGQEGRAIEFLAKRGDDAVLLQFRVNKTFADKLRSEAVPQNMGRLYPGRPQIVDVSS